MNKQQIKEIIKEMIQSGEISIVVKSGCDMYNYSDNVNTVSEVEMVVEGMSIEEERNGE